MNIKRDNLAEARAQVQFDRKQTVESVVKYLQLAADQPDEPWSKVIDAAICDANVPQDRLRRALGVSASSISRWRSGEAEPHALMKREAIHQIIKLLQTRDD